MSYGHYILIKENAAEAKKVVSALIKEVIDLEESQRVDTGELSALDLFVFDKKVLNEIASEAAEGTAHSDVLTAYEESNSIIKINALPDSTDCIFASSFIESVYQMLSVVAISCEEHMLISRENFIREDYPPLNDFKGLTLTELSGLDLKSILSIFEGKFDWSEDSLDDSQYAAAVKKVLAEQELSLNDEIEIVMSALVENMESAIDVKSWINSLNEQKRNYITRIFDPKSEKLIDEPLAKSILSELKEKFK